MDHNKIRILWIRHCISCSNVADEKKEIERRYKIEPLCTSDGIVHTILTGDRISSFIKENFIRGKVGSLKVEIFSSFLPRAMETAKLVSSELIDHGIIENNDDDPFDQEEDRKKIRRLPFISELWSKFETKVKGKEEGIYSTSTTTRQRSDVHAKFLNSMLSQTGLQIDVEDEYGFLDYEKECSYSSSSPSLKKEKRCSLDMKNGYKKFLEHFILSKDSPLLRGDNSLNIIVSHGAFLEKYIVIPPDKKLIGGKHHVSSSFYVDNVDSILVEYVNDDEETNVEQKLLFYLKSPPSGENKYNLNNRRLNLKLNSYEIRKLINSDFGNCNYSYGQILGFL